MIVEIALLTVLLIALVFLNNASRPANFPPGPNGVPLLGYAPFIKGLHPKYLYKGFTKLSDKYGPIVGFYMGPRKPFISVCGYDAVKEVLGNDDFSGRFETSLVKLRTFGERLGYIFTDGEFWQEQRRFALRHLRDLGFGRTSSEDMIRDEIHELIKDIKTRSAEQGAVDFAGFFNVSLLNVLWALIGGERFRRDDEKLKRLVKAVDLFFRTGTAVGGDQIIPQFLLRWFPALKKFTQNSNVELFEPIQDFIRESIEEHEKNRSEDDPRDFIDVYLSEMEKKGDDQSSSFTKNQLIAGIMDLFVAGAETTSNAIGFLLLYMIHHPNIQHKVQLELDQICGDSLPLYEQRASLPYTEAVLLEAQRVSNVAPLGVPHTAMKDTQLRGYFIPKGTFAFVSLYSASMDEKYWPDPEQFRPERHLKSDGSFIKSEYMVPFGAGKRMCLGEALARTTYFLFGTALLKTFEFKSVPGKPLPTLEPNYGLTNAYNGFTALVSTRQ